MMDIIPLNPPVLKKSLAEGTWNMINDEVDKLNLDGNFRVLVSYNLVTGYHSLNELLNNDQTEFIYDLFYIQCINDKKIRKHVQKYGKISDLKKEFHFSLV